MGREEAAKAERAKEREELKAAFLQESLGRLDELTEAQERQKKVVNQQGRALEALANVITSMRGELAALEIAVQPFYRRWAIAAWRYWLELLAVGQKAIETQQGKAGAVTMRRLEEPELTAAELEQDRAVKETAIGAEVPEPPRGPAFDHIHHQYVKDGPFVYACTVPGCGRRADLQMISAEAEYLAIKGGANADPRTTKLQG